MKKLIFFNLLVYLSCTLLSQKDFRVVKGTLIGSIHDGTDISMVCYTNKNEFSGKADIGFKDGKITFSISADKSFIPGDNYFIEITGQWIETVKERFTYSVSQTIPDISIKYKPRFIFNIVDSLYGTEIDNAILNINSNKVIQRKGIYFYFVDNDEKSILIEAAGYKSLFINLNEKKYEAEKNYKIALLQITKSDNIFIDTIKGKAPFYFDSKLISSSFRYQSSKFGMNKPKEINITKPILRMKKFDLYQMIGNDSKHIKVVDIEKRNYFESWQYKRGKPYFFSTMVFSAGLQLGSEIYKSKYKNSNDYFQKEKYKNIGETFHKISISSLYISGIIAASSYFSFEIIPKLSLNPLKIELKL
ncbi:MAG: hypothetical protein IPP04_01145 [Saprospiraceae bacterium]|nr:hypothetical protein [Saprospiraceae bacterium]